MDQEIFQLNTTVRSYYTMDILLGLEPLGDIQYFGEMWVKYIRFTNTTNGANPKACTRMMKDMKYLLTV